MSFGSSSSVQSPQVLESKLKNGDVPKIKISGVANGPQIEINNGERTNYVEFSKTGYTEKGSIGGLGAFEMNMSYNMDYADGIHRLYNPAQDAI